MISQVVTKSILVDIGNLMPTLSVVIRNNKSGVTELKTVFIINAHQEYPFSKGALNETLAKTFEEFFAERGFKVQKTNMKSPWNIEEEIDKHLASDILLLQTPVNWMGVPWIFKKYMDEVYTAGMMGKLSNGDGRSAERPKENYGAGGLLQGKKYMLSLTFNAPEEAFGEEEEFLFQGKTVDDLLFPQHMNFRFFGMESLPTFSSHDVMKNPEIEKDLVKLSAHLNEVFS